MTDGCGRRTSHSRARTRGTARCARVSSRRRIATRCSPASDAVEVELSEGRFPFKEDDEDIHMAIERRLTELGGAGWGKAAHGALAQRPGG